MGSVEATKANSPSQAWGRKTGRWSDSWGAGRLGWRCRCLQKSVGLWRSSHHREKLNGLLGMDRCPTALPGNPRVPGRKRGEGVSGEWGEVAGGRSRSAPLAVFGGGWEAMALSDMCHKCLAPAWLWGSVTVIGSGSCRRGGSSGSGAVIVRGAWKRQRGRGGWRETLCPLSASVPDLCPSSPYPSPGHCPLSPRSQSLSRATACSGFKPSSPPGTAVGRWATSSLSPVW